MSTYTPDRWVVVSLTKGIETRKKVLAGWYGGYAAGDSWKLSSSIENVEEFEDHYLFHNSSGSTYKCYKSIYGMSFYMGSVYASFTKDIEDANDPTLAIAVDKTYEPNRTN